MDKKNYMYIVRAIYTFLYRFLRSAPLTFRLRLAPLLSERRNHTTTAPTQSTCKNNKASNIKNMIKVKIILAKAQAMMKCFSFQLRRSTSLIHDIGQIDDLPSPTPKPRLVDLQSSAGTGSLGARPWVLAKTPAP